MRIERLVWDGWNREHIRKHAVSVGEVEEVVAGRWTPEDTYKGRQQLVGSTAAGRILSVILGPVPNQTDAYYVFSARPASSMDRRRYARAVGGDRT